MKPPKFMLLSLDADIMKMLDKNKRKTGVPKNRQIEDALRHYWNCNKA